MLNCKKCLSDHLMENNFGKFYAGNFADRDTNAMHIDGSKGGGVEEL